MSDLRVSIKGESPALRIAAAFATGANVDAKASKNEVEWNSLKFTRLPSMLRALARASSLYGDDATQQTEVDHWIDLATYNLSSKAPKAITEEAMTLLQQQLARRTWLLGNGQQPTMADVAVFGTLLERHGLPDDATKHLKRWFDACTAHPTFAAALADMPKKSGQQQQQRTKAKDQGKFFELEGASEGTVVTRFPPEASGYLHIGHAKAAMLNSHFARTYKGTLLMRFDDTNPAKENAEFEKVILEDLKLMGISYDKFSHTSDHFDVMMQYMENMLREGKAYVDMTPAEELKQQRLECKPSPYRDQAVEENLRLWEEMKKGTDTGVKCFVRAKIDYKSTNGAMRDPTLYRCKPEPHVRTGDKYKVYPTYDFACPIVDSIEGVTHALRTTEYHDRDEQYAWVCKALGIREPKIKDFSRLNMVYTVMSKRQLTKFVERRLVDGWADPRFPTVRGMLRRGMTVEGLTSFILAMGSSRSNAQMEWDKIWATNKKVIDPVAPRHTALEELNMVAVRVVNFKGTQERTVPLHPKNPAVGNKRIVLAHTILIEQEDAQRMSVGDKVTLMDWGNAHVRAVEKNGPIVTAFDMEVDESDKDFSNTLKLTWLPAKDVDEPVPVLAFEYLPLTTVPYIPKGEDIEPYLREKSKFDISLVGASTLANLKRGDIIQLNRKGFFICDQEHHALLQRPVHLIYIPDGHAKTFIAHKDNKAQIVVSAEEKAEVEQQLKLQKNKVVEMRKKKAEKADIRAAETVLKQLQDQLDSMGVDQEQEEHKSKGAQKKAKKDKAPEATAAPTASAAAGTGAGTSSPEAQALVAKITEQGNKVRELKAEKKDPAEIKAAVNVLLALKAEYKELTGEDPPTPGGRKSSKKDKKKEKKEKKETKEAKSGKEKASSAKPQAKEQAATATSAAASGDAAALLEQITAQGNAVRELKAKKEDFKPALDKLLKLKAEYKELTGEDPPTPGGRKSSKKDKKKDKKKEKKEKQEAKSGKEKASSAKPQAKKDKTDIAPAKGQTRLGLEATKEDNFPEWYSQVITKAELIEYYDVSGCFVLLPWSYHIWQQIQDFFNPHLRRLGVDNCYFPMFVTQERLQREKDHVADFAPEVAWVTRAGDSEMDQPIAIRPTSETIMYPHYAKKVQSHRDLPIKMNQWSNVVRWEFKQATPFLRTREFLWQEGHTAHANQADAEAEVYEILDLYRAVYEDLLAIPVIPGRKTEKEKFAGSIFTTTVEGFIPQTGRGIQGATSHHLGQNFSKMFNISFQDPNDASKDCYAYQNSWGITTRTIGVMIMVHGDNKGLVLPPAVACLQVVVIPTGLSAKLSDEERDNLLRHARDIADELHRSGIRAEANTDLHVSPPWKYNHYELKGVPLRIEVGPRDLKQNQVVAVTRCTGEKQTLARKSLTDSVKEVLKQAHTHMFEKAKKERDDHVKQTTKWDEVADYLNSKNLLLVPFCGGKACEETIKKDSESKNPHDPTAPAMGAKSLCIPFEQPSMPKGTKCIHPSCSSTNVKWTLMGRSY